MCYTDYAKPTEYTQNDGVIFLFNRKNYIFFAAIVFEFDKMQILLVLLWLHHLRKLVWRLSSLRFCALTSVGALFIL